jgi:uncharacterized protein YwgA
MVKNMNDEKNSKIFGADILLMLLYAPGKSGKVNEPIRGKTRLQKELFLAQKQLRDEGVSHPFSFMPYDMGPYSKELYNTIDWLIHKGLITVQQKITDHGIYPEYKLTEKGIKEVENMIQQPKLSKILNVIRTIKQKYNQMNLTQLVELTHLLYPEYVRPHVKE